MEDEEIMEHRAEERYAASGVMKRKGGMGEGGNGG